jgi:hypothetical protein
MREPCIRSADVAQNKQRKLTDLSSLSGLQNLLNAEEQKKRQSEDLKEKLAKLQQIALSRQRRVVDGVYRPLPVDRSAAMMLSGSAPWHAFAPDIKPESKKGTKMSTADSKLLSTMKPLPQSATPIVRGEQMFDINELTSAIIRHVEEKYPPEKSKFARTVLDVNKVIEEEVGRVNGTLVELERITDAALTKQRSLRMNIVGECSTVVNAMKDVRQFFLGPDYEKEQKRLSEFVDLCERLKTLKDSGFLDTVADTMIRLSR